MVTMEIMVIMVIMESIMNFFSDYFHSEINEMIDTITDIRSPAYTWLFLWIFIKIYREITFNIKDWMAISSNLWNLVSSKGLQKVESEFTKIIDSDMLIVTKCRICLLEAFRIDSRVLQLVSGMIIPEIIFRFYSWKSRIWILYLILGVI